MGNRYHTISDENEVCNAVGGCLDVIPAGDQYLSEDGRSMCRLCEFDDYKEFDETEERIY
jgi:hypothetical protein